MKNVSDVFLFGDVVDDDAGEPTCRWLQFWVDE
jgi:hypothetical protein